KAEALQGEAEISGGGEGPHTPPPYASAPLLTHSHCLLRVLGINLRDGKFPMVSTKVFLWRWPWRGGAKLITGVALTVSSQWFLPLIHLNIEGFATISNPLGTRVFTSSSD
ncbi:hypothetical protein Hamer_G022793, partial [Homarus americanus]